MSLAMQVYLHMARVVCAMFSDNKNLKQYRKPGAVKFRVFLCIMVKTELHIAADNQLNIFGRTGSFTEPNIPW